MNKKFSTLVAGLLLAGAVGTANAQYSPVAIGEPASTVVANGAFQLANNAGDKVLALVRDANWYYTLKMVQAGDANLAETLWKISYTENKEGGPSFTFVSAAYGIPLSFTAKNAKNDVVSQFPGNEAVWKWQSSLTKDGGAVFGAEALINNYSAKLDSAIVLAQVDGAVVAQRYKTSAGVPTNALKLKPVEVDKIVLTADDLNSMMMTQDKNSKFKLTFNGEPLNPENGNIWTAQSLKAVPSDFAPSKSMYGSEIVDGDYLFNENQRAAATAAQEAVDALNVPATVAKTVVAPSTSINEVKNWAKAVKAEALAAEDLQSAIDIIEAALSEKETDFAEEVAMNEAAEGIVAKVNAFEMGRQVGVNYSQAKFRASINSLTVGTLALRNAFAGQVPVIYNTEDDFNAAKEALATYATQFNLDLSRFGYTSEDQVNAHLDGLETNDNRSIITVYRAVVADPATTDANVVDKVAEVQQSAAQLASAIAGFTFTENRTAWNVSKFKTEFAALEYATTDDYTEAQFAEIKDEIAEAMDAFVFTVNDATHAKSFVEDYVAAYVAENSEAANYQPAVLAIRAKFGSANSSTTVTKAINKLKNDFNAEGDEILSQISGSVEGDNLVEAIASVDVTEYSAREGQESTTIDYTGWVSLSLDKKDAKERPLYLAVDTNFVTGAAGRRHLKFAEWYYNKGIKNSKGKELESVNPTLWRDYNGHFNFQFTYYPTQDSMVIVTDGYAMEPAPEANIPNWVDIPETMVENSKNFDGNGKTVMLAVLAQNHSEVTVGEPQNVAGVYGKRTLNTRIGFNATVGQGAVIEAGVYTIQYINSKSPSDNGRYVVANWLPEGQALAKVEDQNLNHMPAAQWMLSHENGSNINTIVNRESGQHLYYFHQTTSYLPVQYLYSTEKANVYTNAWGDSLKLAKVDAEALKDKHLGYYAAAEYEDKTGDQLEVYALKYLNNLANVFVNYSEADSILNVTAGEEAEVYFRLIPALDKEVQYGASNKDLAVDLYRMPYYLRLETGNANERPEDMLWVSMTPEGKYKLAPLAEAIARYPFFLKEFKEGDTHSYALIETEWDKTTMSDHKVSVKDYPSVLIKEQLEGEQKGYYGWYEDGRTSTFMLVAKDAPKYRRLGVTVEDGFNNEGTNYAKFYVTRNANRYLYENTANKVAGYDEDPLGLNFLGDINKTEAKKNLAMFIDTAYVRNNTARPQYMLALNPNFDPQLIDCPYDPTHGKHEVAQVAARYLVSLNDSVALATTKTEKAKFMYENRTYTRLAFVDAIHRGDSLIITDSKYTGTDKADKDTINLSKNGWNEGAWQFRLTSNDSEENDGEFYIQGTKYGEYVQLINGVAVTTTDIQDAERFNIETTEEEATANEAVAAEVSVVATQGAIIVKGAAGKVVTVANILGQTIANQVATSDNVTIAAPAGIAVVTVDGEATKVVVK